MFNFKENKEQILQILKLKFNSIFNILIKFTTNIRVNYTRFSKTIDCFILYPKCLILEFIQEKVYPCRTPLEIQTKSTPSSKWGHKEMRT